MKLLLIELINLYPVPDNSILPQPPLNCFGLMGCLNLAFEKFAGPEITQKARMDNPIPLLPLPYFEQALLKLKMNS